MTGPGNTPDASGENEAIDVGATLAIRRIQVSPIEGTGRLSSEQPTQGVYLEKPVHLQEDGPCGRKF